MVLTPKQLNQMSCLGFFVSLMSSNLANTSLRQIKAGTIRNMKMYLLAGIVTLAIVSLASTIVAVQFKPAPEPSVTPAAISFIDATSRSRLDDLFERITTPVPSPTVGSASVAPSVSVSPTNKPLVNSQVEIVSTPTPAPTVLSAQTTEVISTSEILAQVNAKRAEEGIPPLALNPVLNGSAQVISAHHVEHAYAGHASPNGEEAFFSVKAAGYKYAEIGENLAYMNDGASASAVIQAWMGSEAHKNTLLSRDFLEAGVGVTYGPVTIDGTEYAYIVAMHFGRQL